MMNNEGNFGFYEAFCLTTLIMVSKVFYTSDTVIVQSLGTAAWYGTLISCATSTLFFLLLYLLMKRFPGQNIIEIFEAVTGKVIGKILALAFSAYILYYAASNLREFVEMIKAYNLPYTQPSLIIGAFIGVSILMAYFGLEGLARISGICFVAVMIGLAVILLLAIPYYDVDYLKPYYGYGLKKTIVTSILRSSAYEEVIILAIIINSIHGLKTFKRAGLASLGVVGATFSISVFCYLLAFQYTVGSENTSGIFQLSRIIYYSRFFQRLESIFLFTWVISSVIAVSVAFYISIRVYCKAWKIKNHRPLLFPFAYLLFMIALLPMNMSEVFQINLLFIRQYSLFFVYLVPVAVLIISLVLKKKGDKANVQNS